MQEYKKIESLIDEVYSLINTLPENTKKVLLKKAIKDENYILQYIMLDDPIQDIYSLIEMSAESQLEG